MSRRNEPEELTEQQLRAIDLLVAGHSVTDTAQALGVARETVSRWKNNNAYFIAELSEARDSVYTASADRLRQVVNKAAGELEALVEHKNPQVRLKAIALAYKALSAYPNNGRVARIGVNSARRIMYLDDI